MSAFKLLYGIVYILHSNQATTLVLLGTYVHILIHVAQWDVQSDMCFKF